MRSLFHHRDPRPPVIEPVPTIFPRIEGADIAAVFSGERIAGDFYDSIRVSPERVLIGLLDAAGPRDANRNLLSAAQEVFRTVGPELFASPDINEADAMTELSLHINRKLLEVAAHVHPCPAFIACYHEKFGTLCYTNAGHTSGLLRDGKGIVELDSTGLPLGLFSHATADSRIVALEKGAILLLVSRGVIACERHPNSSDEFGLDRVKLSLQATTSGDAKSLCVSILNAASEFTCAGPPSDDRTALALIRTA
ncbi:MAG: PP2C family protein-serine/threonine phosphatase [Candidatus Sulfotelmatobacter sp.]